MPAKAAAALQDAKVTFFVSGVCSSLIYAGSLLWLVVLFGLQATLIQLHSESAPNQDHVYVVLFLSVAANGLVFVTQTIDYCFCHFLFWPVTAKNWCGQLTALGGAASMLAIAAQDWYSEKRDSVTAVAAVLLVGQAIFTGSQFAVTLEYIERRLLACTALSKSSPRSTASPRAGRV